MGKDMFVNSLKDRVKTTCGENENLKFENKALVKLNAQIFKQPSYGNNGCGNNSDKMARFIKKKVSQTSIWS